LRAALRASADTSFMVGKLIIVAFLAVILYNLGAGLYYMMVDKGTTNRTVKALTRRIALSVGLILIVMFSIWMGWITPHDLGR
jgi:succinate dehydrogenase/fumarate reductase cytochrome b subunit